MAGINVVARLNGQFATCDIATFNTGDLPVPGTVVVALYEWEVTITSENTDVTAHGDFWRQVVPLKSAWTARARAYFTALQSNWYGTVFGMRNPGDTTLGSTIGTITAGQGNAVIREPPLVRFSGYNTTGGGLPTAADNTQLLFQGQGYLTRANINFPMAMVEQEIEIEGSGSPLYLGKGS